MIDPTLRWQNGEKPEHAGLLTFAGMPYTEDAAELEGFDVAIIGAPMDELVSESPGTRFGPRAIGRPAALPALSSRPASTPWPSCGWSTSAMRRSCPPIRWPPTRPSCAPWPRPSPPGRSRSCWAAITRSPSPTCAPAPRSTGRSGCCTSTPTPTPAGTSTGRRSRTGRRCTGWSRAGGSIPRRYAQVGLRGYWPGPEEFAWQERHGITAILMQEVRETGIAAALERALAVVGAGPGLPVGRRGRARSGLRPGHRHARAGRHDAGRPPVGVPQRAASGSSSSGPTWSRCHRRRSARPTSPPLSATGSSARS